MLRVLPFDAPNTPQTGDLFFNYHKLVLFMVLDPVTEIAPKPGFDDYVIISGEEAESLFVAEVEGSTWTVRWWPTTGKSVEEVADSGHRITNEVVARRFFPHMPESLHYKT